MIGERSPVATPADRRASTPFRIVIMLSLSACSHQSVYLEDGVRGASISCGRFYQTWATCLKIAGNYCRGNGYLIHYHDEIAREMLISCKPAAR